MGRVSVAIPDQAAVKAILADFEDRLRAVVERAWQQWLDLPDRGKFIFPRVRAVLVFDYIAQHALVEFANDKNVRVIPKGKQTIHFLIKNEVLLRFKKGNAKGVGSNIQTQEVLDFIDPQRVIPGLIPEIMKVELCHMPDGLGLDLEEVAVVARNRTSRIWAYPIPRKRPGAKIIPMPPRQPDQTPPSVDPRNPRPDEDAENEE